MSKKKTRRLLTLQAFIDKNPSLGNISLNAVAVIHPETGEKIYICSQWENGFWFRYKPLSLQRDGQVWPCGYTSDLLKLRVHPDAKKELGV